MKPAKSCIIFLIRPGKMGINWCRLEVKKGNSDERIAVLTLLSP